MARLLSIRYCCALAGSVIFPSDVWLFSFLNMSIAIITNFAPLKSESTCDAAAPEYEVSLSKCLRSFFVAREVSQSITYNLEAFFHGFRESTRRTQCCTF